VTYGLESECATHYTTVPHWRLSGPSSCCWSLLCGSLSPAADCLCYIPTYYKLQRHQFESNTIWRCCQHAVVKMEWLYRTCHRRSGVSLTLFPDDTCDHQRWHWSCLGQNFQLSATMCLQLHPHVCETVCCQLLPSHRHCLISKGNWQWNFFCTPIPTFNCFVVLLPLMLRIHYSYFLYLDHEVLRNYTFRWCNSYLRYITIVAVPTKCYCRWVPAVTSNSKHWLHWTLSVTVFVIGLCVKQCTVGITLL